MTIAFDPEKHCGAHRNACDRERHGADWDGKTCDQLGVVGHRGSPCRRLKGWGTDHNGTGPCRRHFGQTPTGKIIAAKEAVGRALEELGVQVDVDPRKAILTMVAEAFGNVIFLRERARALGLDLIGEVTAATREGDFFAEKEEVRAIVRLYGEWTDRVVKYSKIAIDAGIAEARLELEKQQVETIVLIVNRAFDAAGLTAEQRQKAVQATVNELRTLEAVGGSRN